jgi:[citrate (pro-3S)-lyase] ligase
MSERIIRLSDPKERKQVEDFLARLDLSFEDQVDYTVALYRDDEMIGTGSLKGSVLRNVAIDETIQGEGLTGKDYQSPWWPRGLGEVFLAFNFSPSQKK